jgi:hypothetical protein
LDRTATTSPAELGWALALLLRPYGRLPDNRNETFSIGATLPGLPAVVPTAGVLAAGFISNKNKFLIETN